jgi:hypothetical protein
MWEGLISAMTFGTIWFFLLTIAWILTMFYCIEKESNISSTIWVIVYLLFLQFLVKVDFLYAIIHHPIKSSLCILGYIVIGFIWSFVRWWIFVNKEAEGYQKARFNFLTRTRQELERRFERLHDTPYKNKPLSEALKELENITLDTKIPDFLKTEWKSIVSSSQLPKVSDNKAKISLWVMYWPVSLVWSFINDLIKKLVRSLITQLRVVYEGITKLVYRRMEA